MREIWWRGKARGGQRGKLGRERVKGETEGEKEGDIFNFQSSRKTRNLLFHIPDTLDFDYEKKKKLFYFDIKTSKNVLRWKHDVEYT